MSETKHTPTPWRVFMSTDGQLLLGIGEETGEGITDSRLGFWRGNGEETQANAEFIVRAVNAYDADQAKIAALVEALKNLSAVYDSIFVKMSDGEMAICREAWAEADAAIRLAESGQ